MTAPAPVALTLGQRPHPTQHWADVKRIDSTEQTVSKHVFTNPDAVAESVLYKYPTYADRTVICCSTQSGCPVGCRFCGAGDNFVRNLTADEIADQPIHLLEHETVKDGTAADQITNLQIMFMSMGEPLLNQRHLIPAIEQLHEKYPHAALLISTSAPRVSYEPVNAVSERISQVGLQFSVHESTDEARNQLIPFKAKLTLAEMAQAGLQWADRTGRRPFFNYCVHERNNTPADVERLHTLFDPDVWEATISVICERDETLTVAHQRQRAITEVFQQQMIDAGFSTRMFDPAGQDDVGGGCGQLHWVQKWFRDNPDKARPSIGRQFPILHAQLEI